MFRAVHLNVWRKLSCLCILSAGLIFALSFNLSMSTGAFACCAQCDPNLSSCLAACSEANENCPGNCQDVWETCMVSCSEEC